MSEEQQAQAFIAWFKQQMERFNQTQQVEWKGNFGVWSLLAGAIYLAKDKSITIAANFPCLAVIILAVVFLCHLVWLLKIHDSQRVDKRLWVRYRGEALTLLRGGAALRKDETESERTFLQEATWLTTEAGITLVLCVLVFILLQQH
jgi:hypothetical protein